MTESTMVAVSSFAKDEYGISAASVEAMTNYGYVLLAMGRGQPLRQGDKEQLKLLTIS